jgi:hypothetical protein
MRGRIIYDRDVCGIGGVRGVLRFQTSKKEQRVMMIVTTKEWHEQVLKLGASAMEGVAELVRAMDTDDEIRTMLTRCEVCGVDLSVNFDKYDKGNNTCLECKSASAGKLGAPEMTDKISTTCLGCARTFLVSRIVYEIGRITQVGACAEVKR